MMPYERGPTIALNRFAANNIQQDCLITKGLISPVRRKISGPYVTNVAENSVTRFRVIRVRKASSPKDFFILSFLPARRLRNMTLAVRTYFEVVFASPSALCDVSSKVAVLMLSFAIFFHINIRFPKGTFWASVTEAIFLNAEWLHEMYA